MEDRIKIRLQPFASAFMALFGRKCLPHRSTVSRYLAALDQPTVEALRTLILSDLIVRTSQTFPPGGLWDRQGHHWLVIDIDGTKQAARQRALPSLVAFPAAHRRFDQVCAPGYLGRKRGEVARVRTTVLQAHSHHWLGTFGGPGNGDYRGELGRALEAILSYASWLCMPLAQIMIRLDGLYGNGAVLKDLVQSGVGITVRSKDYGLLDLPTVQTRLQSPPDQSALFFGPLRPPHGFQLTPLLWLLLFLSCGETGHGVRFAVDGFVNCARKPSN